MIARQVGHTTTEKQIRVYSRLVPNLTRQGGSAFKRLFIKDDASLAGLLGGGNSLSTSNREMLARWIEAYLNDPDHTIQPVELEVLYDDLHKALLLAWWDWNEVASEAPGV